MQVCNPFPHVPFSNLQKHNKALLYFRYSLLLPPTMSSSSSRRLRAFKRWMKSQSIECSEALSLTETPFSGISVNSLCDLTQGDVVATIPKAACITIKTSKARGMIEEAELGGVLGLSVALMYEKSLGEKSLWYGYLQMLPERECVPLVWTLDEVDRLLLGTELHKIVREDKNLIYEDWKECILPLVTSEHLKLDPETFGAEQYFAAKSLVTSRSFEIDDYHGYGMVPLADLFNHKTGAENIHFTSVSSYSSSDHDDDGEDTNRGYDTNYDILSTEDHHSSENGSLASLAGKLQLRSGADWSVNSVDDPTALEIIIVKDVKAGDEVYNTYGSMGNAALLHRYGFTEPNNPFDIVNIDLDLVLEWSSSLFSDRYRRSRLSLWRRLDCSGCVSQNSEYFEVSLDGEPQLELLMLLYVLVLPDEVYHKLNETLPSIESINKAISFLLLHQRKKIILPEAPDMAKAYFLTTKVCGALVSLADIRESFYGTGSLDDDKETLSSCSMQDRKFYHSLVLRVRERSILSRLRTYASSGSHKRKRSFMRKS